MLTQRQTEIINGSLLGDGSIWTNFVQEKCKFTVPQSKLDHCGVDKNSYFLWWMSEFSDFGCSVYSGAYKCQLSKEDKLFHRYVFCTKANLIWNDFETKWYKPIEHKYYRRKKIIPPDLILTPLALCVWFMEDGSNNPKDGNLVLETQGFTKEEVDFLIHRLDVDLGIESHKKKTKKLDQFRIYVGIKSYHKFLDVIRPHVAWDCFKYKLEDTYSKLPHRGEDHSLSKLTDEIVIEMLRLRKEGISVEEIGELFNVSIATVSGVTSGKRWKHLGLDFVQVRRFSKLNKHTKNEILTLCNQGCSQKEVAAKFNVDPSTISRLMKKQKEYLCLE